MDEQANHDHDHDTAAREETARIVSENENVQTRVRGLVLDTIRNRRLELDQIGDLTSSVIDGAMAGLDSAVPADSTSTLRQVFGGLEDAISTTAHATKLAIDEARGRGADLAEGELAKAIADLKQLEQMFLETVSNTAGAAKADAGRQLKDLVDHARRTGTSIGPSVKSALKAAASHPIDFSREATVAGVEASRQTAGFLMHAMAGLLQAGGDLLTQSRRDGSDETDDSE